MPSNHRHEFVNDPARKQPPRCTICKLNYDRWLLQLCRSCGHRRVAHDLDESDSVYENVEYRGECLMCACQFMTE